MQQLQSKVQASMAAIQATKYGSNATVESIIENLIWIKTEFALEITLDEIWKQEQIYFETFGMCAFDCGYVGLRF